MWKQAILVFTFLCVVADVSRSNAADCDFFLFEKKESLSLQDLSRIASSEHVFAAAGAIKYETFDAEDSPSKPGWHIVGFLTADTGDLAAIPVGGFLWSRHPAHLREGAKKMLRTMQSLSLNQMPPLTAAGRSLLD